jgi:hypothetical protein
LERVSPLPELRSDEPLELRSDEPLDARSEVPEDSRGDSRGAAVSVERLGVRSTEGELRRSVPSEEER